MIHLQREFELVFCAGDVPGAEGLHRVGIKLRGGLPVRPGGQEEGESGGNERHGGEGTNIHKGEEGRDWRHEYTTPGQLGRRSHKFPVHPGVHSVGLEQPKVIAAFDDPAAREHEDLIGTADRG